MAGIQFEEEQRLIRSLAPVEPHGLADLVQKLGLAKDSRSANYILLGIIIVAIMATLLILFGQTHVTATRATGVPEPATLRAERLMTASH